MRAVIDVVKRAVRSLHSYGFVLFHSPLTSQVSYSEGVASGK